MAAPESQRLPLMRRHGVDANTPLGPHAGCLRGAGIDFCGRYAKAGPHALSKAEAHALSEVGLAIVTIFEWGSPTQRSYFSAASGKRDGERAHAFMQEIGQPPNSACYFTADYDASFADITGVITDYFHAVHVALEEAGGHYAVGVYGSGATCGHILAQTPTQYSWLAMSTGWLHSRVFSGFNIRQLKGETVCGVQVDTNETRGAFGAWELL